jgi:crotonobetainyl-CoA:carnitine CoA-transferase CaiB-like acyl-CoA transferase
MVFKQLSWNVAVLCPEERRESARAALGVFRSDGAVWVGTPREGLPFRADILVRCGCCTEAEDADALLVPVGTEIELVGVRVEDGSNPPWTSCSDLIAYMRSGLGVLTRVRDEGGIRGLPYLAAGHLTSFFLGLHAVMLGSAVMLSPSRPRRLCVSAQECMLATLHNAIGFAQVEGRDAGRKDDPPKAGGRFECLDGVVTLSMPETHQWQRLVAVLGDAALASEDWWRDQQTRDENRQTIATSIGRWCRNRTRAAVFITMQQAGVPAAFMSSPDDLRANTHLRARGFFADAPDRVYPFERPFRVSAAREGRSPEERVEGDGPRRRSPGEVPYRPLAGVRVCDLSWAWAGPLLTERLAMLGASVVKVESRDRVDTHRVVPPFVGTAGELYDRAFGHLVSARGKLSVTIDLKHPDGLQMVKDLIRRSDLLVSNFVPGALERLGLGFDVLAELVGRRGFVAVALSGFGATGPWRHYRAYGLQLADLSGLTGLTGTPETPPISMGIPFGDPLGGTFGAAAALHYLRESRALGMPLSVELAQYELLVSSISDALRDGRATGNRRRGDLPGTGVYPCKMPETWLAISIARAADATRLREIVGGCDAGATDFEARVAAWAANLRCQDAATLLRRRGIDCTEVMSPAELLGDTSLRASGYWVPSPEGLATPNAPWTVDGERATCLGSAPRLGEHNDVVARDVLGYSDEHIDRLKQSGAMR